MIGLDLVEVERMKLALERTPRFRDRVFTPIEIAYCETKKNPYPSYAVRFAAKEAFRKLHSSFSSGTRFHDVETVLDELGHPILVLHGNAKRLAQELEIDDIMVSTSHAGAYAAAALVAVKRR